jgi:hypothetical protein
VPQNIQIINFLLNAISQVKVMICLVKNNQPANPAHQRKTDGYRQINLDAPNHTLLFHFCRAGYQDSYSQQQSYHKIPWLPSVAQG